MKITLLLALQGALASATKIAYGPNSCVGLDLSSEGTCVIATNCAGVNLDNFEFSFDCTTPTHEVQRHSFGFGGFDEQEEFDTSVKCTICEPPTDKHHVLVGTGSASKTTVKSNSGSAASSTSNTKKVLSSKSKITTKKAKEGENDFFKGFSSTKSQVVKYGPDECVQTYRNNAGHCVMETKCEKENINDYEFGLICVDKTGEPVRHVFGKNSFDPEESFDTLIACDKCLGLDDVADESGLMKQVVEMTEEVKGMADKLEGLEKDVTKLKEKTGLKDEKKDDEKKEDEKKDDEKKADSFAHVSSSTEEKPVAAPRKHAKLHLKTSKKHSSHHRKIQKEEDTDEDDDQDQDQDQDREQDEDAEQDQEQDDQQDDSDEQ